MISLIVIGVAKLVMMRMMEKKSPCFDDVTDSLPPVPNITLVPQGYTELVLLLPLGMYGCGVYGAIYFKPWGIMVAGAAYAVNIVFVLSDFCITCNTTLIVSMFFMYPHILFVREMKRGIMNDYNYHQIAFCCCGTIRGRWIAWMSVALLVIIVVIIAVSWWMLVMRTSDDGMWDDDLVNVTHIIFDIDDDDDFLDDDTTSMHDDGDDYQYAAIVVDDDEG